ncbi:LTA synthase family protein, partial [Enterococcus faecium]|nr:LTA synthase family protein [Enterococcus faecium]
AITEPTEEVQNEIDSLKEKVDKQLAVSDQINNGDLLRFYTNSGLDPIDTSDYDYKNGLEKLKEAEKSLGDKSTSVFSQHNRQSTVDLYKTQTYQELHGTTTGSSE